MVMSVILWSVAGVGSAVVASELMCRDELMRL